MGKCFVLFNLFKEVPLYYLAQAGIELSIFIPLPPKVWITGVLRQT